MKDDGRHWAPFCTVCRVHMWTILISNLASDFKRSTPMAGLHWLNFKCWAPRAKLRGPKNGWWKSAATLAWWHYLDREPRKIRKFKFKNLKPMCWWFSSRFPLLRFPVYRLPFNRVSFTEPVMNWEVCSIRTVRMHLQIKIQKCFWQRWLKAIKNNGIRHYLIR